MGRKQAVEMQVCHAYFRFNVEIRNYRASLIPSCKHEFSPLRHSLTISGQNLAYMHITHNIWPQLIAQDMICFMLLKLEDQHLDQQFRIQII